MKLVRQLTLILLATCSIAHGNPTGQIDKYKTPAVFALQTLLAGVGISGLYIASKLEDKGRQLAQNNHYCAGNTLRFISYGTGITSSAAIIASYVVGSGIVIDRD
ncbi:MAG TPA: hypothetical protein VHO47_04745 [Candidatus Babeliales bacterium]|nr:hypothetical protein [Candidatus Babeliales bacterium]